MLTSVFHNTNEFATYIGLCFPLLAVVVMESRRIGPRLSAAALCAAAVYCLLSTGSRANFIAVGLATATLFGLSGVRRPVRVVVLIAIACFVAYQVVSAVITKATDVQLHALKMSTVASEAAQPRGQLVKDGLDMLAATKGAGVGAGNVELHMARLGRQKQNVHNWWLEILVNLGVVCFALYLGFYATTMLGLYRVYRAGRDPYLQGLSLGLFAGLVGFTVGCLSSSSLIAWPPMWIYFGLCLAVIEAHVAAQRTPADASPSDFASLPQSG
jgi:teichuronic acid biosynthesis protein TuaE